jgi:hypothetical protein
LGFACIGSFNNVINISIFLESSMSGHKTSFARFGDDSTMSTPPTESFSGRANQSPTQDKFAFLQEITGTTEHVKDKLFYTHLFNVYTYLKERGLPEEVCDAGLYHSIYGTEFYKFHHDRITRDVVRGLIGDYAEELVYVFCTTKGRFKAFTTNSEGREPRQARDLCVVEFANLRDQNKGGRNRQKLITLANAVTRFETGEGNDTAHD